MGDNKIKNAYTARAWLELKAFHIQLTHQKNQAKYVKMGL